jgi:hypothetical protein
MDNYNFGRSKEELVADFLSSKGFKNVQLTPGSRGWFDVAGQYPNGRWILIQVKASRTNVAMPVIASNEKENFRSFAVRGGHEAWVAYVVGINIEWEQLA